MEYVIDYLDTIDAGEVDPDQVPIDEPISASVISTTAPTPVVLKDAPDTFAVLCVLSAGNTYLFDIWEQIHKHSRLGLGEASYLVDSMISAGLIEMAEPLIDLTLDDEPLQLYHITDSGRNAMELEQRRRELEQRRKEYEQRHAEHEPGVIPPDTAPEAR